MVTKREGIVKKGKKGSLSRPFTSALEIFARESKI